MRPVILRGLEKIERRCTWCSLSEGSFETTHFFCSFHSWSRRNPCCRSVRTSRCCSFCTHSDILFGCASPDEYLKCTDRSTVNLQPATGLKREREKNGTKFADVTEPGGHLLQHDLASGIGHSYWVSLQTRAATEEDSGRPQRRVRAK